MNKTLFQDKTVFQKLRLGQSVSVKALSREKEINSKIGTETRYVDLAFKTFKVGDQVTLTNFDGAIADFKIQSIGQDNTILVGPLNPKAETAKPIAALINDMKIGQTIRIHTTSADLDQFKPRIGDIVHLIDKSGKKIERKVYMLFKDYIVLVRLGASKPGWIDKLRFAIEFGMI